ncbi:MAG TPA: low temperature requirement protein A [Acidimicrobiales bacterium]|nr:low temperature requirement protein A [Acidimicrobiales bacterium]
MSELRGSVIPDIAYMRSPEGERRATFFELFFDLVYVFAITQLSHHLLEDLTWAGAAEAAFLLCAVYWAWNYTTWMTNWFDPEVSAVRLVLVLVMLASLLMAVAIPEGFGDHGLLFAASYCALQVGRNAFVVGVTPPGPFHRNFQQILTWSLLSVPLWVGGALAHGGARWGLWLVAFGLDLAAPLARFWLPGFGGGTPMIEWAIDAGHFAERFQLFVIIVLGESIILAGATATDVGLEASVVVALGVAFGSSVALWWLYFGQVARAAVRRMAADEVPGQVGRDAYTYLHLPIVAGILLTAVGDELVIAHPGDELGTAGALVTLAGPAMYLLGLVAFGARVGRHQPWTRVVAAVLLLAAVPLAADGDGLLVAGLATALLVALVVADRLGVGHPEPAPG